MIAVKFTQNRLFNVHGHEIKGDFSFKMVFVGCPIGLPIFFYFSMNEPELGAGIDPNIALTHFHLLFGEDKIRTHNL